MAMVPGPKSPVYPDMEVPRIEVMRPPEATPRAMRRTRFPYISDTYNHPLSLSTT